MDEHKLIIELIIAYTLAGAFVFTVIITCLSLVGWIRFADPQQQKKLFYIIIVELAALCIGYFGNFINFNSGYFPKKIIKQREMIKANDTLLNYLLIQDKNMGQLVFSTSSSPELKNGTLMLHIPRFKSPLSTLSLTELTKYRVIERNSLTQEAQDIVNELLHNNLTIYNRKTEILEIPGLSSAVLRNNILLWRNKHE